MLSDVGIATVSIVTNGCDWLAITSGDYGIRNQVLCMSLRCRERQMDREPAKSCQAQQGEGREREAVEENERGSLCLCVSLLLISPGCLFPVRWHHNRSLCEPHPSVLCVSLLCMKNYQTLILMCAPIKTTISILFPSKEKKCYPVVTNEGPRAHFAVGTILFIYLFFAEKRILVGQSLAITLGHTAVVSK